MDGERTNTICLAVISSFLMELQHEKSTLISASLEKRETERLCPSMEAAFPLSFFKDLASHASAIYLLVVSRF